MISGAMFVNSQSSTRRSRSKLNIPVDSSRSSLQGEWRISRIFSSQYYFLSFYKIFSPHQLKKPPNLIISVPVFREELVPLKLFDKGGGGTDYHHHHHHS